MIDVLQPAGAAIRRPKGTRKRLAFVVSHPVQYYAPLYRRLAQREDLDLKVYFTWHAGEAPVHDRGFATEVAWDVPVTEGYAYERVPNVARDAGTHRFLGLRNPTLVERVLRFEPDAVHVTGWAWSSHLAALRTLHARGVPTLFRGDSHLLDGGLRGPRGWMKRALLARVYMWPSAFLVVGTANHAYYRAFGVPDDRLLACPHSIDVARFAEPAAPLEADARAWRRSLAIGDDARVVLYAGKLERRKRPLELMRAVAALDRPDVVLVLVGGGELQRDVDALARSDPRRFRVLPFQNQSRMPAVYRLGDVFVLPSAYGETWGLAVNEAMASGRAVIVSDRVGCAADAVDASCGRVFPWSDSSAMIAAMRELLADPDRLRAMGAAAAHRAWAFDVAASERALIDGVRKVCGR